MSADEQPAVHLVIIQPGGLFGAYLDEERAHEAARNVEGVVAAVPITGDYRTKENRDG